jgi:hypothetical protein
MAATSRRGRKGKARCAVRSESSTTEKDDLPAATCLEKGTLCGPFVMELAGLEPATSWVRFHPAGSSLSAMSCGFHRRLISSRILSSAFAAVRDSLLDQNLTTMSRAGRGGQKPGRVHAEFVADEGCGLGPVRKRVRKMCGPRAVA